MTEEPQLPRFAATWRGHWIAVGVIAGLVLAAPFTTIHLMGDNLKSMTPVVERLALQPHVRGVALTQNSMSFNGHAPTHSLVAAVQLDAPLVEDADLARQLAKVIGESQLDLSGEDSVVVSLSYGFNMGIARANKAHGYPFRPGALSHTAPPEGSAPESTQ